MNNRKSDQDHLDQSFIVLAICELWWWRRLQNLEGTFVAFHCLFQHRTITTTPNVDICSCLNFLVKTRSEMLEIMHYQRQGFSWEILMNFFSPQAAAWGSQPNLLWLQHTEGCDRTFLSVVSIILSQDPRLLQSFEIPSPPAACGEAFSTIAGLQQKLQHLW